MTCDREQEGRTQERRRAKESKLLRVCVSASKRESGSGFHRLTDWLSGDGLGAAAAVIGVRLALLGPQSTGIFIRQIRRRWRALPPAAREPVICGQRGIF
ncbi:hypothetical protein DPEC_G00073350 [Dallia pectoralis]|uniref:Uncharacterized protein n=1 Tax=Dallia pectoralis TaxID=75939 RepID=A0ACC2H323_DALPE|nr:hypothetical protein DPEC_G00073350 [Dallia pectoralis]